MAERKLQVGDPIPGEKVNPLTIGLILDPPVGHLLIDAEHGYLHTYWNRWIKEEGEGGKVRYRKVLTHHGGPNGMVIEKGIDQSQIVIGNIMGAETEIETPEELEGHLLKPPFTLRTYAQALRIGLNIIEIPGEKRWMNDCLYLIDRTIRGASYKMAAAELNSRVTNLAQLHPKFDRSKNPYMESAGRHLMEAVQATQSEQRDEAMRALLEMGRDVNQRAQELTEILEATIKREAILERYRNSMEDVVRDVHGKVTKAKEDWDGTEDEAQRQKIIAQATNLLGVRRLSELTIQPFRKRAQRPVLKRLIRMGEYLAEGDAERVGRVLTEGEKDLIRWKEQIDKRIKGEYQLRYPTKTV